MNKLETYIIYGKNGCDACDNAIKLLKEQGKTVLVKKYDEDASTCKKDMAKLFPDAKIIPQVFVVTGHFNGFEELEASFKKPERAYSTDEDETTDPWEV